MGSTETFDFLDEARFGIPENRVEVQRLCYYSLARIKPR
jgi:hypothetical protein